MVQERTYTDFRLTQKSLDNATMFHNLNIAYNKIIDDMNKKIAGDCGKLIKSIIIKNTKYTQLTEKEKNLADFLKELEYIGINKFDNSISINVPIFYESEKTIINDIGNIILLEIFPIVKDVFENFETDVPDLTSVRHKVDIKEIAIELWHQIFGAVNEYLVKKGFVALPNNIDGEGRYLKSIIMQ